MSDENTATRAIDFQTLPSHAAPNLTLEDANRIVAEAETRALISGTFSIGMNEVGVNIV